MSSFEIVLYITSFNTIFIVLCFIYIYSKDKDNKNKKAIYTRIFEEMQEEIHFLKKTINIQQKTQKPPVIDNDKLQNSIKKHTISILNEVLPSIVDSIHKLDNAFSEFKKQNKEISSLSSASMGVGIDNKRVIALYESGKSIEEISRKLGISKSEVDLIIKMRTS